MKKMLKKELIIGILIGVLLASGIAVYAAIATSADKVSYNSTTVDVALNDLYSKIPSGEQNITQNGTYDISGKASVNVRVTTPAGTKTPLWTNSNPNSSMPGTNITLNDSLSNYTHILIQWKAQTNSTTIYDDIFKIQPYRSETLNEGNLYAIGREVYGSSSSIIYTRYLRYLTDTTMRFPGVRVLGSDSDANSKCIPIAIYGLNISY